MEAKVLKLAISSEFQRAPMAAILHKGSKILGQSVNKVGRYQGRIRHGGWHDSIHAEIGALLDALKRYDRSEIVRADIIVCRVNRHGELRLAYPCENCYNTLTEFGIRRCYFSKSDGTYGEIRI